MDKKISIVIPSFNGKQILENNLPSLIKAAAVYPEETEVIIVDDASTDGSVDFIKSNYPRIKLVCLDENLGFARACNAGAKAAKFGIIYFLNNDISVQEEFLKALVHHFQDNDVFAVVSRDIAQLKAAGNQDVAVRVNFKLGMFWYRYQKVGKLDKAIEVIFAPGGRSAYSRDKFFALGCFDELYRPAYWEDWDVSYRACKCGWKIIYEPKSQVYHPQAAETMNKLFGEKGIKIIQWKDHFLFTWKNITAGKLLFQHFLCLPLQLIAAPLVNKTALPRGLFRALKQIKEVLQKRKVAKSEARFSDYEVIRKFYWIQPKKGAGR